MKIYYLLFLTIFLGISQYSNAQLSGTYTINASNTTSGTNFQSFADFRSALTSQGVSGAVTVNVAVGSGPYNEQVIFDNYSGLSNTNTITINGHGESIIFNPSYGLSKKYVVGFVSGSRYFVLDSLFIKGNYGFGVGFDDNTEYITIRNCTIRMVNQGNSFGCVAIGTANCVNSLYTCSNGSNASHLTIENNTILGSANSGSYHAIYLINKSTNSRATNNIVQNNSISGFASIGIYLRNQDSLLIKGNSISKPLRRTSAISYGIRYKSDTASKSISIVNNEIFNLNGGEQVRTSDNTFGIHIESDGSINDPIKIHNNVIYGLGKSNGSIYGINASCKEYLEISNNSILLNDQVNSSVSNTIGIYLKLALSKHNILNNNILISRENLGSNYGVFISDSLSNSVIDNNNVYLSSSRADNYYGRIDSIEYSEISDWKSYKNGIFGANSFSSDPFFISSNNLTPRAEFLNNSGFNNGILSDFYGNLRDTTPDIGAIEFECGVPNLAHEILNDTSVNLKLNYIGDSSRMWNIEYDTLNFGPGSGGNRLTISTWDTIISNLFFNKNYTLFIRSICNVNDTGKWSSAYSFRTIGLPIAGNYTIDSSKITSGRNFQSFIDLIYRLEISGISDSVIVDVVKGSGPYNQQVIFESINGLDSLSPLIVNGNRETLMFSPNTSDYRILGFDNVNNIIIDSLIVKNLHQNYGFNIHLKNNTNHITIKNSIIDYSSITQPYNNSVGIFADNGSSSASFLKILNNTVKGNTTNGVFSAIILQGGSSIVGNEISGNSIQNFTTNGIYAYNQKNLIIKGNEINNNVSSYPSLAGINISGGNSNNIIIENNRIEKLSLTNALYNHFACGVRITSNVSSLQSPIIVRNNIIKEIFSDRDLSGVRINGSGVFQIFHNTLYLNDTINNQGNLSGLYYETNALAPEIYNNIVSLNKGGVGNTYSYFFKGGANSIKSGNNSFQFGTSGTGKNYVCHKSKNYNSVLYETILEWQNSGSIQYDVNTVIENPEFESDSILRPTNFVLKSGGVNLEVSEDYYGISRDNTPDIGAVNLKSFNYPYYPINRIVSADSLGISDSLNIYCETSGTVASIDFDGEEGKEFYIIDQQSGTQSGVGVISDKNISNYSVNPGDSIRVSGQIVQHNGQISINPTDIELIQDSVAIIIPNSVSNLVDSLESTLVRLENLKLLVANDSSDYLLSTTNNNNDTLYFRIDSDTDINDSLNVAGFAIGDSICSIVGIVSQFDTAAPFNSGYRLIPNYFSKIDTISCVQTDFELAQKDTLVFELNNCTDSIFFKYTLQNLSNHHVDWTAYALNDTLKEDFESGLKMFWSKSKGVSIDTSCESVNGTNALTFRGKSGLRYLESHPLNLACQNNLKLTVKKGDLCDSTVYSTENYLRLQYSSNYGVTWETIKTITTSGNYDVPLNYKSGLLKFRIVQFASSTANSQIWIVDDFIIEPNLICSESINYLKTSGTIAPNYNFDLSGYISTQNKYSGSVFTTIPVYTKDTLRKVNYLTIKLNYNKSLCPEFYFENMSCGSSYKFINKSSGKDLNYFWNFGDGDTSTLASPNHFFDSIGNFKVSLLACDSLGCESISKQIITSNYYGPKEPPCRGAINNSGWGNNYFSISYVKIGPDTIYAYINDNYSSNHSIDHTCETRTHLQVNKQYKIRGSGVGHSSSYRYNRYHAWIDYNNDGFFSKSERIMATNNGTSGDAYFTAPDTAIKNIPLRLRMIAYSATSTYPPNLLEDCNTSVPTPRIARDFTVILSDTLLIPEANFKDSILNCGNQVEFTSTSLNNPDTYSWDFGDGESSNKASSIHTYKKAGSFEVSLIVKNKIGADTLRKTVFVSPLTPPQIIGKYIPYCTLNFLIQDSVKYKYLNWDFGNNINTSGANIHYAFSKGGTYPIQLTSLDTANCLTEYKDTLSILNLEETVIACDSFVWINGVTYTESDTALKYIFATDSVGCDSILTLNLTINKSSLQRDTIISCDQYVWPLNGKLYIQPGVYIDTVQTSKGCDSIGILNLSLMATSSLIDSITRCDSYYWSQTGETYLSTGIYIDTLINAVGCDSLRVLDLTINSTLSIDSLTVLDSLFWTQTGTTYYLSGFYTDTLKNRFGCDSILGVQLKINSSDAARISISQSIDTTRFSVCNNDSASFILKLQNLGDRDTLFWEIQDLDNGLYFDNFENGFKSSLWKSFSNKNVIDSCGVIYGSSSINFKHNTYIETQDLNTTNADSLFFVFRNNRNCENSILGDQIKIYSGVNHAYYTMYSTVIQHFDSIVHLAIPLPSRAKGSNVKFKIELPINFSHYPSRSDITLDNFRIGGRPDSIFTPFVPAVKMGYILPLDSHNLSVGIDRSALVKGWQNPKLYIKSNDSLNQLDSITLSFLLDGIPCADFSSKLIGCESEIKFENLSTGSPTFFFWDFGDSTFSNEKEPIHSYLNPGIYSVKQVVCTRQGCDTSTNFISSNSILKPKKIACDVSRSSWTPVGIINVTIGTINNNSGFIPYEDHTCLSTNLDADTTHVIQVTTNNSANSIWVFIDFNNDASFDTSEKVIFSPSSLTHSDTFAIPTNAVLNKALRMRIGTIQGWPNSPNKLNGCNTFTKVQYEDYTVFIQSSSSNPKAQYTYRKNLCNDTVAFVDYSLSYPNTWFWDFGDDSTSNLQHPIHVYTKPGLYSVKLKVQNQHGQDSLLQLVNVPIIDLEDSMNVIQCDSYTSPSGNQTWTTSGNYIDTIKTINGCDSLVYVDLTIGNSTIDSSKINICQGDSVLIFGSYQHNSGSYIDSLQSVLDCDSIQVVDLFVELPWIDSSKINICAGDSALIFGSYQRNSGKFIDSLKGITGCDSITIVELLIEAPSIDTTEVHICQGDSVLIFGTYKSNPGTFIDSLQSVLGCDSIVVVELAIEIPSTDTTEIHICQGDSIFIWGYYYSHSAVFTHNLQSTLGCDSILVTNLFIDSLDLSVQDNSPTLISNANNVTYQWLDCINNYSELAGDTFKTYTTSQNGTYAVEITEGNCVDTSACQQVLNVALTETVEVIGSFNVLPNPNTGLFTFKISSPIIQGEELLVFNDKGKLITTRIIQSMKQIVDLQELSSGVYVLKYSGIAKKIVIIKR